MCVCLCFGPAPSLTRKPPIAETVARTVRGAIAFFFSATRPQTMTERNILYLIAAHMIRETRSPVGSRIKAN